MCACCAVVDGVQFPSDDVINTMKRFCVLYCTVSCSIELEHEEDLARWRRRRMESSIN